MSSRNGVYVNGDRVNEQTLLDGDEVVMGSTIIFFNPVENMEIEKSLSRPHVSNDNPYSEAQFKTMKYRPDYPKRFGSIEDARAWAGEFFPWYNEVHHHSGIGLLPPAVVHYGEA